MKFSEVSQQDSSLVSHDHSELCPIFILILEIMHQTRQFCLHRFNYYVVSYWCSVIFFWGWNSEPQKVSFIYWSLYYSQYVLVFSPGKSSNKARFSSSENAFQILILIGCPQITQRSKRYFSSISFEMFTQRCIRIAEYIFSKIFQRSWPLANSQNWSARTIFAAIGLNMERNIASPMGDYNGPHSENHPIYNIKMIFWK